MSIYNKLVFGKYKFKKLLGKGSFGFVVSGKNIFTDEEVAMKVEDWKKQGNLLEGEAYILFYLKGLGIPEVKSFGIYGKYKILVQTLLGETLENIFIKKKYVFSLKDVCMIALQLLDRLEFIHSKYIIHRDIKPENIMVDLETRRIIYLIDFGLAKKYRSSRTGRHIKFNIPKRLTGTARYASVNSLRGTEQSRRDDLESAGYLFIYFARKGYLPWQGLAIPNKLERYRTIYKIKKSVKPEVLCEGLPTEFVDYLKYVKELKFEEQPNYNYLKGLFIKIINGLGINDLMFSWLSMKEIKMIKKDIRQKRNLSKKRTSPQIRLLRNIQNSRERENNLKKINDKQLLSELEEKQEQREKEFLLKREKERNNNNVEFDIFKKDFEVSKNETQIAFFNKSINMEGVEEEIKNNEKPDLAINKANKINENLKNNYNNINNRPILFNLLNGSFNNAPLVKCLSQFNNKINYIDIDKNYHSRNKRNSIKSPILTEEFIQNNIILKMKVDNNKINDKKRKIISSRCSPNKLKITKGNIIKLNERKINGIQNNNILIKNQNFDNFSINLKKYRSPIQNINVIKGNKINHKIPNIHHIEAKNLSKENVPKNNLEKINLNQFSNINNYNYLNSNSKLFNLSKNNIQRVTINNLINKRNNSNKNFHNISSYNYNSNINTTSKNQNILLSYQNSAKYLNQMNIPSKSSENNFYKTIQGKFINKLSISKSQKTLEDPINKDSKSIMDNNSYYRYYNNYIKNKANKSYKNIHQPNKVIKIYKKIPYAQQPKLKKIKINTIDNSKSGIDNSNNNRYYYKLEKNIYQNFGYNINNTRNKIINSSYINSTKNNFNFNIINNNSSNIRQRTGRKFFYPNSNLNANNNINITLSNDNINKGQNFQIHFNSEY